MSQMDPRYRKRILMFYFAAGINLVMAMWVLTAGTGQVAGGMLGAISLVFLVFAYVNFRFARSLRKRWEEQVRQQYVQQQQQQEQSQTATGGAKE
jgi:hypothetical protein